MTSKFVSTVFCCLAQCVNCHSNQCTRQDSSQVWENDSCNGDEAKRKMLSTILIVGGGLRFPGAATHLHSRLSSLLGPALPPCEVIIDPKEGESDWTCWRGAGVLASLESARELWIRPKEWERFGQKLLRERAPFPWA